MGLMDLFRPGYKHSDPGVRSRAVAALDDQKLLAEIARTDDSPRVRKAAVERVTDEELLSRIAMDAEAIDVRVAAVQRISSQTRLAGIIKHRRNLELMGACFARITDRDILGAIARDAGYNMAARRIAFENFADESFLSDVEAELHPKPEKSEPPSGEAVEAILRQYGGERVVRAIGKFRGSEKALHAMGEIARRGGDPAELAVEYLVRSLNYSNPVIQEAAEQELSTLRDPELVAVLIRELDHPDLRGAIRSVLEKINTPEARAALGRD